MSLEEFEFVLNTIKNKKDTHPNLSRLWGEYLLLKKEKFEKDIEQAKIVIENMEVMSDLSWESITLLTSLSQILRENTT
jgi:hypothetical protein